MTWTKDLKLINNFRDDLETQLKELSKITLRLDESTIKILIVLLENLGSLQQNGVLELLDQEAIALDALHKQCSEALENKKQTLYRNQLESLLRKHEPNRKDENS